MLLGVTVTEAGTPVVSQRAAELGPDAHRAWRAVQEIQLHGEGRDRLARACTQHEVAPSSVKALLKLSATKPTAMRELAAAFACDASFITSVVDALEQRGLAVRGPHPTDRRIRTVLLTERGREVSQSLLALLSEPPSAVGVLSPEEQRQLADLLERVAAADVRVAERRASSA
jgi:DNA-binding MarR family transcriptional regulator